MHRAGSVEVNFKSPNNWLYSRLTMPPKGSKRNPDGTWPTAASRARDAAKAEAESKTESKTESKKEAKPDKPKAPEKTKANVEKHKVSADKSKVNVEKPKASVSSAKFKRGETVVAMDQGLPYDAVVLKTQTYDDDRIWLFLHFKGWSRRYDCWHMAESVAKKGDKETVEKLKLKYNGSQDYSVLPSGLSNPNLTSQKQNEEVLSEAEETGKNAGGRARTRKDKQSTERKKRDSAAAVDEAGGESDGYTMDVDIDDSASAISDLSPRSNRSSQPEVKEEEAKNKVESDAAYRKRKRGEAEQRNREIAKNQRLLAESDMMEDPDGECASLTTLGIPPALKKHLVDEWSFITEEPCCLVSLPREHTVRDIIQEYLGTKKGKVSDEMYKEYEEVFDGMKMWFDKALPMILLYRQEREQFDKVRSALTTDSDDHDIEASTIYGVEHLMRAMVQIGKMTANVVAKQVEIDALYNKLGDFLKFVNKNFGQYSKKEDYVPAQEAMKAKFGKIIAQSARTTRKR